VPAFPLLYLDGEQRIKDKRLLEMGSINLKDFEIKINLEISKGNIYG
jgi:hypothetical protein